jgi:unsaturated rhamnogalacturonyl hydrolase
MNRRSFLSASVALSAAGAAHAADAPVQNGKPVTSPRIARAVSAAMALQRRDWEQGVFAQAMLEAGDDASVILLTKAAVVQKTSDGRLAVVGGGGPTDPAMGGSAYWRAGELTKDPEIQKAAAGLLEFLLKKAPRSADGLLYHVFNKPEFWSDGFNGAPPFLAERGLYDEALKQIDGFKKRLWNPEKKLLAHIWHEGNQKFSDGAFWGVGNGWTAGGLARVIRALPAERKDDRARLAAFVQELIDGCLAYQRPDGLFHNIIDKPDTFVETNMAQMLATAIYKGARDGWLPKRYVEAANKMRAAARAKQDAFGLVQGVCGAPNFDHYGVATEGQSFFIMMEVAGMKYEAKKG